MSLNRQEGNDWQWQSRHPVEWTNWAAGGPQDDEQGRQCAYLIVANEDPCCPNGTWFRETCGTGYPYACEDN
ncbi:MAG: hypothetical protein CMH50_01875 [Myxococcales bacterium]|nr:hypothetical protein [Myxococcales bacterium]